MKTLFALLLVTSGFYANAQSAQKEDLDTMAIDHTVNPGDNFYKYANGEWLKKTSLPPTQVMWSNGAQIAENMNKVLLTILNHSPVRPSSAKTKKLGDFFTSAMDTIALNRAGFHPVEKDFLRIAGITSVQGLINEIVYEKVNGVASPVFNFSVTIDKKNANRYLFQIGQGGISFPDRDMYIQKQFAPIQKFLLSFITKSFQAAGDNISDADKKAQSVYNIETDLAKSTYSKTEARDPYKTYNKYAWSDLSSLAPSVQWQEVKKLLLISTGDSLLVSNPPLLTLIDKSFKEKSLEEWKDYLEWNVLKNSISYMGSSFENEYLKFTQLMSGQKASLPREQRVLAVINSNIGDLLSEAYINQYFNKGEKISVLKMVNAIQSAFAKKIQTNTWMSAATKAKAIEKLNAVDKKVAFPDHWETYESLVIEPTDYLGNVRRTAEWNYKKTIQRLNQAVNKSQWNIAPTMVNAAYRAPFNDIVILAGILQKPYFSKGADDALNYGAIGTVIAHEFTHGFDDQGRQYSASGDLHDWWNKEDAAAFQKRADALVQQYNNYTVLDSLHVNGMLTLGENIADLGGLSIAYEAFKQTPEFKKAKKIDGYTPSQRFFLSYAQAMRDIITPQILSKLLVTDFHSPSEYRVNGSLTNFDPWYSAFNITAEEPMYKSPDKRITIW